jgi:hypothetical protein
MWRFSYFGPFFLQFNFHGIISSCFEPYMNVYIELEEKSLVDQLEKLVQVCTTWIYLEPWYLRSVYHELTFLFWQEERWEIEEGSQTNILSSSMQVDYKMLHKIVSGRFAPASCISQKVSSSCQLFFFYPFDLYWRIYQPWIAKLGLDWTS